MDTIIFKREPVEQDFVENTDCVHYLYDFNCCCFLLFNVYNGLKHQHKNKSYPGKLPTDSSVI